MPAESREEEAASAHSRSPDGLTVADVTQRSDSYTNSDPPPVVISDGSSVAAGNDATPPTKQPRLVGPPEYAITGISGKFPESENMAEFEENLMNMRDMVTEDDRRWPPGYLGMPKRNGKLKSLKKFDARFFGVTPKLAELMDPQLRLLMEVVHEAIVDAGVEPSSLRGSRTGVFVGASASETEAVALCNDPDRIHGYTLVGCARSMFANRISYAFDLRGPSMAIDTACSSSLTGLSVALDSLRSGHCDAAIVAGVMVHLLPANGLTFVRLNMMSDGGACKSFDAKADGYAKGEAVVAVLIQRKAVARRLYAEVVHAKCNADGYKSSGITMPSGEQQGALLAACYAEADVPAAKVTYFEAHGTGTIVGDPQECQAIQQVLCADDRASPLLIGSVKSNMGHSEPASALCSIAKVIIGIERGIMPPNLHYHEPNPYIPALADGTIKVVDKPTAWSGGYVGINSFGFGGANAHVILKTPDDSQQQCHSTEPLTAPKLVAYAGPTKPAVERMLHAVQQHMHNQAFHSLVLQQANASVTQNVYRGYVLMNRDDNQADIISVNKVSGQSSAPVWFVYSGMGSQWPGMALDLMRHELFQASLLESSETLRPLGVDPYSLIMKQGDADVYASPVASMVCIASIQVALTDLLRAVGVQPAGIVGHSTGEIAAAYADGCVTRAQAVLCAYYRAEAIHSARLAGNGAMAAVGLTAEQAQTYMPADGSVVVACHNAQDSVTISGDKQKVTEIVDRLKSEGKFARLLNTAGVAFHSAQMQAARKRMMQKITGVIPNPQRRSSKWISSCFAEADWQSPKAQFCSAEYQVHNAMNPVLFHEAVQHIPDEAVVIEIGAHALLQSVLRRSLPDRCHVFGLQKVNVASQCEYLWQALGNIHQTGVAVNFQNLYQPVNFPVPRGTPMLSSLVEWEHSEDWAVTSLDHGTPTFAATTITLDPINKESPDHFLLGHMIDGRPLFPFMGHVWLAWRGMCKLRRLDYEQTPVLIEDYNVYRPIIMTKTMKFDVICAPGGNRVEVYEGTECVSSGRLSLLNGEHTAKHEWKMDTDNKWTDERSVDVMLQHDDLYKMLTLRGYDYGPEFKVLHEIRLHEMNGAFIWTGHWVAFLDAFLQTFLMGDFRQVLQLPARVRYLKIDPDLHRQSIVTDGYQLQDITKKATQASGRQIVSMVGDRRVNGMRAGGVELFDPTGMSVQRRMPINGKLYIERIEWFAYEDAQCLSQQPSVKAELAEYRTRLQQAVHNSGQHIQVEQDGNNALLKLISDGNNETEANSQNVFSDALLSASTQRRLVNSVMGIVNQELPKNELHLAIVQPTDALLTGRVLESSDRLALYTTHVSAIWHAQPSARIEVFNEAYRANVDNVVLSADGTVTDGYAGRWDLLVIDGRSGVNVGSELARLRQGLRQTGYVLLLNWAAHSRKLLAKLKHVLHVDEDALVADWPGWCANNGWQLLASQSDPTLLTELLLVRCGDASQNKHALVDTDDIDSFSWLESASKAFEDNEQTLVLTSAKTPDNGLHGMAMCLRDEAAKISVRPPRYVCDVSLHSSDAQLTDKHFQQVLQKRVLSNAYRDGRWGCFQAHLLEQPTDLQTFVPTADAFVNITARGDMSSLRWFDNPSTREFVPKPGSLLHKAHVHYAALNFRDIMLATGRIGPEAFHGEFEDRNALLGVEFSGLLDDGRRVMGMVQSQGIATEVIVDERYCIFLPDDWTLEGAATIPMAYVTAYMALCIRAKIKQGETVLIHSGSGAVGQAAIAIALYMGAVVYTTVGSTAKQHMLQELFPQLKDNHFANSRSLSFEQHIKRETNGRGVDVVLNSLAEDKLQASVRCLATHGRFLEIGKYDLMRNNPLGMQAFMKNIAFHGILLDACWGMDICWEAINMLTDAMSKGHIKPMRRTVFQKDEVEQAFRFMSSGQHTGKVLIQIRPEPADVHCTQSVPVTVQAVHRLRCAKTASYIVTGGLGGFGMELCKWLVERGAKNLVISSRSGVRSTYQAYWLQHFRQHGVQVVVSNKQLHVQHEVEQLVAEAEQLGPVGGVFHLAMVLRDALLTNQTTDNLQEVAKAKYWGTRHLDAATRRLCDAGQLKWFVVFSSQTAGRGNAGQCCYGWANSCMERVVEQRRRDSLSGLAIQWGAIGDVGVIIDNAGTNETVIGGTLPQRIPSCLQVLELLMLWDYPLVGSYVKAENNRSAGQNSSQDILQSVANILGLKSVSDLDLGAKLGDLGIDSLMGLEIVQVLERHYNVVLNMNDMKTMTLEQLRALTASNASKPQDTGSSSNNEQRKDNFRNKGQLLVSMVANVFNLRLSSADINEGMLQPLVPLNQVPPTKDTPIVFFVHSIEGVASPLRSLGAELTLPALCLQCTPDTDCTSVHTMAKHYIQVLESHVASSASSSGWHLVGYSYGAAVAFEMASQLNAAGKTPLSITLIDGSPKYWQIYREAYRSAFGLDEAEDILHNSLVETELLLAVAYRLGLPDADNALRRQLMDAADRQQRSDLIAQALVNLSIFRNASFDINLARFVADAVLTKFHCADKYEPAPKSVRQPVHLIRAGVSAAKEVSVGGDYGLAQLVDAAVHVHSIDADHDGLIQGQRRLDTATHLLHIFLGAHN